MPLSLILTTALIAAPAPPVPMSLDAKLRLLNEQLNRGADPRGEGAPVIQVKSANKSADAATETTTGTISREASSSGDTQSTLDKLNSAVLIANEVKVLADEGTLKGSSKLIERGISVGAAATVVVHLATGGGRSFDLKPQAAVVAMPYLALYPAYWGSTEPVQKFCASKHSREESDARRAADVVARKRAEVYADQLLAAYAAGSDDGLMAALRDAGATPSVALTKAVAAAAQKAEPAEHAQSSEALIATIAADPELIDWPLNSNASCGSHMLGVYVGRPADFDVTYRSGGNAMGTQSHTSIVSAGLAFTPSAYVSLLVGYTYGRVSFEASERTIALNAHSLAFSLGGNLDFLTTLTRL
jgi:hypothetical protein